jgi:hypothetical protein
MTIGSGLGGSVMVGAESTYGTAVTPTRGYEVLSSTLKRNKRTSQGGGLSGGTLLRKGARRNQPIQDANGSISLEVTPSKFGLLLAHITGTVATPSATGAGYTQTYPLADSIGRFLTIQEGMPDTGGTANPYTFVGSKITKAGFSCEMAGNLTCSLDIDSRQVTEVPTLTTPAFTSNLNVFHGGQMGVKIGTYGSEAAVQGVKSVSVDWERPMAVERFYANNSGLKSEPVQNGVTSITGSLSVDLVNKADFADRFAADTAFSLVWEFIGAAGTGYSDTFRMILPQCYLDEGTPTLDNEDVINTAMTFTCEYDGSHLPTIVYIAADSSI